MPNRKVRCTCTDCVRKAGHLGALFESSAQKVAHLVRRKSEEERDKLDDAAAHVFAATLLDPGSIQTSQSDKLWSSRDEFQETRDGTDDLLDPTYVPQVEDIVQGISRLRLPVDPPINLSGPKSNLVVDPEQQTPPNSPSPSISNLTKGFANFHLEAPQTPTPSMSSSPTSRPDKNSHKKVQKDLMHLNNMKLRLRATKQELIHPSHEILCNAESVISDVRDALRLVTRNSISLEDAKKAVFYEVESLQCRIIEWRTVIPGPQMMPVFDSSKLMCNANLIKLTRAPRRSPLRNSR
jgi:hypothetical protein